MKRRARARAGEQAATGEVRPVTNRTLITVSIAIVLTVTAAITAIIIASGGTKTGSGTKHGGSPVTVRSQVASLSWVPFLRA